jgi:hypothetical protein
MPNPIRARRKNSARNGRVLFHSCADIDPALVFAVNAFADAILPAEHADVAGRVAFTFKAHNFPDTRRDVFDVDRPLRLKFSPPRTVMSIVQASFSSVLASLSERGSENALQILHRWIQEVPARFVPSFLRSVYSGALQSSDAGSHAQIFGRRIRCDRHRVWPDRRGHFLCSHRCHQRPRYEAEHQVHLHFDAAQIVRTSRPWPAPLQGRSGF